MDELKQYKERLRIALNAAKICVFEVDLQRQLYTFFENAETIFGVSGDEILKDVQPFSTLEPEEYRAQVSNYFSHPEDAEVIKKAFESIFRGKSTTYEARMRARNSEFVWCSINVTPIMENGEPIKMIGVITDITNIKETTDHLKQAVKLDNFTGVYNKAYATASIIKFLCNNKDEQHALMIVDVDNFKSFNDTYGHAEGDKIIKELSDRISNCFRKSDIIGRFGGDEFIVFIKNSSNEQWLRSKFEKFKQIDTGDYICTISAGISIYPQDALEFNELFKKADQALYLAKNKKKSIEFYSEMNEL